MGLGIALQRLEVRAAVTAVATMAAVTAAAMVLVTIGSAQGTRRHRPRPSCGGRRRSWGRHQEGIFLTSVRTSKRVRSPHVAALEREVSLEECAPSHGRFGGLRGPVHIGETGRIWCMFGTTSCDLLLRGLWTINLDVFGNQLGRVRQPVCCRKRWAAVRFSRCLEAERGGNRPAEVF